MKQKIDISTREKLKNEIRRRIRKRARPLWQIEADPFVVGDYIRAEDAAEIVGRLFIQAEKNDLAGINR